MKLACRSTTCKGLLELTLTKKTKVHHKGKTRLERKTIVLAKASYTVAAGRTKLITIKLTAAGRKQIAKLSKHKHLSAMLSATLTGGSKVTRKTRVSRKARAAKRPPPRR